LVTERAQVARELAVTERIERPTAAQPLDAPLFSPPSDPPGHAPVDHRASPETRRLPAVRVDEDAIEHPAPRRAFSPAEALRLAAGTAPTPGRRLTASPSPEHRPDPDRRDAGPGTDDPTEVIATTGARGTGVRGTGVRGTDTDDTSTDATGAKATGDDDTTEIIAPDGHRDR
jgi:hypothetical protein